MKKKWIVAELYAGIGRTWEALRDWPKGELCLLADVNESAQQAYLANHPNAPYHRKDLARTDPLEIQSLAGGLIDVLLGCPPSTVGRRVAECTSPCGVQKISKLRAKA